MLHPDSSLGSFVYGARANSLINQTVPRPAHETSDLKHIRKRPPIRCITEGCPQATHALPTFDFDAVRDRLIDTYKALASIDLRGEAPEQRSMICRRFGSGHGEKKIRSVAAMHQR